MKRRKRAYQITIKVLLGIVGLFTMAPILLALMNSFKTNGELLSNVIALPKALDLENYIRTFDKMSYWRSLGNTVFLAAFSVILICLFSAMAGWKLCRTKTKLAKVIYGLFVFSMLIPFSSIMIPLYKVVLSLGLKNSLAGLSLIYAGTGTSMAIFIYYGFVKSIPIELEEAAAIDGCSSIKTFFLIVFPMLKATTATVCITNMLWVWNDFLLPLIVLSDNEKYTLLLSTNTLFGQYSSDWTAILSALILAALPAIVLYIVFQKQIMRGIADGAVKG
ncbi:MAG TPA: carbohydrate ABC transporter permease [Candidatus Mediterraneibacter faecavium]|uniref:Carbohydrate ABC transporter permease n=1 Tax=Candidatus Mediterraneibacter faecavium TaxID=2838668 RepID=A0A9D2QCN0_9FIRM|nr:carbohydrate ABC transporter permease [Candidatus Mediterraneibacter faecavium]